VSMSEITEAIPRHMQNLVFGRRFTIICCSSQGQSLLSSIALYLDCVFFESDNIEKEE